MNIQKSGSYLLGAILSTLLIAILITPPAIQAQDAEQVPPKPDLRKWSLQIYGGTFIARTDMGITPFTGSTGVRTDIFNPSFGAGIEYMATPSLGINVRYTYAMIENDPDLRPYENIYQSVSAGVSLYILNLTMLDKGNNWFNPYISLNAGVGQSNRSGMEGVGDSDLRVGHYGFGFGTRFRLGSAVDLSLDYMYHQFNPGFHIDGYNNVNGVRVNDRLAGFMGGLVFNLGTSRRQHARWYSPVPATQEWRRSIQEAVAEREDDWDRLISDLEQQDTRLTAINRDMQDKADRRDVEEVRRAIAALEMQIAELEDQLGSDLERINEIHHAAGLAYLKKDLETGFYIQTYAARSTSRTHQALELTRDGLARRGYDTDNMTFSIFQLPSGLYSVQIGNLRNLDEADDVLTGALDIFDDSFVREHRAE